MFMTGFDSLRSLGFTHKALHNTYYINVISLRTLKSISDKVSENYKSFRIENKQKPDNTWPSFRRHYTDLKSITFLTSWTHTHSNNITVIQSSWCTLITSTIIYTNEHNHPLSQTPWCTTVRQRPFPHKPFQRQLKGFAIQRSRDENPGHPARLTISDVILNNIQDESHFKLKRWSLNRISAGQMAGFSWYELTNGLKPT